MSSRLIKFIITIFLLSSQYIISQNRAPSLYLNYQDEGQGDIIINTLNVQSPAPLSTYYCGLLWNGGQEAGGYCGMQEATGGRTFIFSIWDPISTTLPITAEYAHKNTEIANFGGEGTGLRSLNFGIGWETNSWYSLVSRAWSTNDNSTLFGYWVYDQNNSIWHHIVTMNFPVPNVKFNTRTSSFIEDYGGNGYEARTVYHKNGWKRKTSDKSWIPFNYTYFDRVFPDAGTVNYIENYDGGVINNEYFFMTSGGSTSPVTNIEGTYLSNTYNSTNPNFEIGAFNNLILDIKNNNLFVNWDVLVSKSPQFSYHIKIFDNAELSGNPIIAVDNIKPHLRNEIIDISTLLNNNKYYVQFYITDIFDNKSEAQVQTIRKIIPELFLDVNTLKFSGTPSALNITNCEVLPLIKDNAGMVLSALDLETETLFLTQGSFFDDENIAEYDNEVFIENFIKKSNQKILVITTSWSENTYKNFNKLYDYLRSKGNIISFDFNNGDNVNLNNYDVIIADIQSSPEPATVSNLKAFINDPNKKSILIGIGWVWKTYYSSWANENPEIYPMNIISQDLDIQFDLNNYGDGDPFGMKFYPYTLTDIDDLSLSCLDKNRNGISDKTEDDDIDGVINDVDTCPNTPTGENVNETGCSQSQIDDDGDGVMNNEDTCSNTPTSEEVNATGCSESEIDDDGDGVMNNIDTCPDTPSGEEVNATGCSESQIDDDGDGVMNNIDTCPDTPSGEEVNATGCSQSQIDEDGDGIMNNLDLCPNSTAGATVNENGCFFLPANNFSISVISETCPGKNNGELTITANEIYSYTATINVTSYNFSNNSLTVPNLQPGTYSVCISVVGETFEQCYTVVISEGTTISGKASLTSNKSSIVIEQGTAPYNVFLNGKMLLQTNSRTFDLDVKHGDLIQVKTAVDCEGIFSKTIDLFETLTLYPNPTNGIFDIALPFSLKEVKIELYTINSKLITSKIYSVENGKVRLNIGNLPSAMYLVKVYLENPVSVKIIKK